MTEKKKTPKVVIDVIETSLEERTGKDRRKKQVSSPFLNPSLERRKKDRRDGK